MRGNVKRTVHRCGGLDQGMHAEVFGTGGSRRAGEQAAAKLALEAVQVAFIKTPAAAKKSKPRTTQLKLAGIATIQGDAQPEPVKFARIKAEPKRADKPGNSDESAKIVAKSAGPKAPEKSVQDQLDQPDLVMPKPDAVLVRSVYPWCLEHRLPESDYSGGELHSGHRPLRCAGHQ